MEVPADVSTSYAVAGILVLIFFLYALFNMSRRLLGSNGKNKRQLPPEAGGGWPVIGHLHKLSGTEPTHITLAKMADAYGPIFTIRFGMYRALIASNWEIARECLTTNDRIFASRPKLLAGKLLGYDHAIFGASPYGPYWRKARKLATLQLLTTHRIDQFLHLRRSEVQSSIKKLYLNNNGDQKVLVDMKVWFGDITLNTIFRMVVGKRFSTAFDDGCGNKEKYREALRDVFELFGVFIPSDTFPFLRWMDLGGHQKAMKKTAKVVDEVFDKWLKEHQHRRNSGQTPESTDDVHDFMDVMLSVVQDGEFSSYDSDTVTKATCLTLILAGSDTTTITMVWALSLLLNNKEALRRVQFELDEQVGRQRQVKESDVKNLIYLQAVVKETLRLYPAGPIAIPHESMEDCTVAGYHIPARTRLIVNLQKLQRDPLVWDNPCEFRPERFLTSQKDFDFRGHSPQFIPFGTGSKNVSWSLICPSSFAYDTCKSASWI